MEDVEVRRALPRLSARAPTTNAAVVYAIKGGSPAKPAVVRAADLAGSIE
jgi:hypothetical protein